MFERTLGGPLSDKGSWPAALAAVDVSKAASASAALISHSGVTELLGGWRSTYRAIASEASLALPA